MKKQQETAEPDYPVDTIEDGDWVAYLTGTDRILGHHRTLAGLKQELGDDVYQQCELDNWEAPSELTIVGP